MKVLTSLGVTAAALLTLSACGNVVVNDLPPPRHSYFNGDFEYATRTGAIVTEIIGNPFAAVPDEAFKNAVRNMMRGQNRGRPAAFVGEHGENTVRPFRVAVAFNMPRGVDGHSLCRGPAYLPPPARGSELVNVAMAFCYGDSLKTDADGWALDIRGLDDPRFAELVKGVTGAMLPSGDGMDMSGDGGVTP